MLYCERTHGANTQVKGGADFNSAAQTSKLHIDFEG